MSGRGWLLATLVLAACEKAAPPAPSRPWTMFDLAQAFEQKQRVLEGVEGVPGGFPSDAFVKGSGPLIPVSSAFTDGQFSPYITTNLWENMPEVWIQPMYILVEGFDATTTHDWIRLKDPTKTRNAGWIFTVGPRSRFHSPFWRTYFAQVPPGTQEGAYTSSEQILRDRLPLVAGPGRLVSLVPDQTVLGGLPVVPTLKGDYTPPPLRKVDYLDGEKVTGIDFGRDRFDWNDYDEVIEQPFFVLVTCRSPTDCGPSNAPNIGGTGPLFARRPAIAPGGRPRFGSFWRLYLVALPMGDAPGLFIPASVDPQLRETLRSRLSGLAAPLPGFVPDVDHQAQVDGHYMQVALNAATCFKDQASFDGCQWLDSQGAIEELLPGSITRTGINVTCPFVGYDGMDVKE
jgi:hypothetical protein